MVLVGTDRSCYHVLVQWLSRCLPEHVDGNVVASWLAGNVVYGCDRNGRRIACGTGQAEQTGARIPVLDCVKPRGIAGSGGERIEVACGRPICCGHFTQQAIGIEARLTTVLGFGSIGDHARLHAYDTQDAKREDEHGNHRLNQHRAGL